MPTINSRGETSPSTNKGHLRKLHKQIVFGQQNPKRFGEAVESNNLITWKDEDLHIVNEAEKAKRKKKKRAKQKTKMLKEVKKLFLKAPTLPMY